MTVHKRARASLIDKKIKCHTLIRRNCGASLSETMHQFNKKSHPFSPNHESTVNAQMRNEEE